MPKKPGEPDIVKVFLDHRIHDFSPQPLFMAIGTFDGVHLGHKKLIEEVIKQARKNDGMAAAYTFRPHPTVITYPANPKPMICSFREKYKILKCHALIHIFEQQFDEQFSQLTPLQFIKFLKKKFPTLKSICVGKNFKFGHNRTGNTKILANHAEQFEINATIIQPLEINGERISSSRIRELLKAGNSNLANLMLGRNLMSGNRKQKACNATENISNPFPGRVSCKWSQRTPPGLEGSNGS